MLVVVIFCWYGFLLIRRSPAEALTDKHVLLKTHKGGQPTSQQTNPPDDRHGYGRIHQLLHTSEQDRCSKTHVLKGENAKEPDVHICLDAIPTTGCVVYSIGIANNWIFDDFMIEQGCQVFSFDPSMAGVKKHKRHANHLFEPIGIGTIDGMHTGESTLYGEKTNYEVETLGHIMERHGHTHLTMVRMDVESAEWAVLEQWLAKGWIERMDQLLLEIHMWKRGDEKRHSRILHSIPMELFHTAKNHWDGTRLHGDMTRVYEMGWIRRSPPTSMVVVFYYHDPTMGHASYIPNMLRSFRQSNPTIQTYFITASPTWTDAHVHVVRTSEFGEMPLNLDQHFGGHTSVWKESAARFWYIQQWMLQTNLRHVVQVECDQLIFGDIATILRPILTSGPPLRATQVTVGLMTAAIMYIRDATALGVLVDFCSQWYARTDHRKQITLDKTSSWRPSKLEASSEMSMLGVFQKQFPLLMATFPILPTEGWSVVFDPASYGQWEKGLRTLDHHIIQKALITHDITFDPKSNIVCRGTTCRPLFNIHRFQKDFN